MYRGCGRKGATQMKEKTTENEISLENTDRGRRKRRSRRVARQTWTERVG